MALLRPFRDYDEHDVLNLFAFDYAVRGAVKRGALVHIKAANGWKAHEADVDAFSSVNMNSYSLDNVVNLRYGVTALVDLAGSGENALGMLLYDVDEFDENGEKLIYNPRKAAEMQTAMSGQAVPIATKGIFVVNGVDGTPAAGGTAYCGAAANDGLISATAPLAGGTKQTIGKFLGAANTAGDVLLKLEL
tara:strand:+ start:171 stop:743 length:573 start_codon:yes stop_codon:yes gene_type:complete